MGVSWIPVLFFTLVWGIVAGILPFVIPRGPHKGVIQVRLLHTRVVDPDYLDPDSLNLWIRIGNHEPGSGSKGKKSKKFQWKNALFSYFFFIYH
jgi:hypothetical protein